MTNPDALVAEATQTLAAGPNPALLARLETAWRAHPTHPGLALRRADALQLARRHNEAAQAYAAALTLNAMSFDAWYGMAGTQLALGAYANARDAAVQALGLAPNAEGARSLLAEALFALGEVDELQVRVVAALHVRLHGQVCLADQLDRDQRLLERLLGVHAAVAPLEG